MRKVIVFSILIIIPALLIAAFWSAHTASSAPLDQGITGVGAAWYHPDWHYRVPVTVTNSGTALTNYQVLVKLDSSFDFTNTITNGADLRVTASDGITPLSFWIESWVITDVIPSTKAWVWVKAPSLPVTDTIVYLYYGNDSAESASDGAATFEAYDGFENYPTGTRPTRNYYNPGEWTRYPGNPVLTVGAPGTWDAVHATFASVIWDERVNEYRMYYHGINASAVDQIGLATSADGMTWTKYAGNPILTPGPAAWDASDVRVPMVWKEGANDYRMIYTGSGATYGLAVGYATSSDGIGWTKHASNPVLYDISSGSWSYRSVENWGVIKVDSEYLMWYSDLSGARESGIATSTDLINWTPYAGNPIFSTSGITSDWRYSQFCPFTFKYGSYYYVLVASYSSVGNYARYYMYRSSSPYFPTGDRTLVRVGHMTGASGQWDEQDSDTPMVFTSDIERSVFPGDQLWTYYAGASETGGTLSEGLMIETDIAAALADAVLPYGVSWSSVLGEVSVVSNPVRQGLRSVWINDTNSSGKSFTGTFTPQTQGVLGAWMGGNYTTAGDYDLYARYNGINAAVGGLGHNGLFHYWNGEFRDTGVSWAINTWYLVTLVYSVNNPGLDYYDFVVYDQNLNEIVRVNNIRFGNDVSTIDYSLLNTSKSFVGNGYGDDFRLRKYASPEPTTAVRSYSDIQETQAITGAGTPDFSLVGINVEVVTQGSLTSLQVVRYEHDHPNGTYAPGDGEAYGTKTGRYWEINPNNSGYSVNLTLPHNSVPDGEDKVCRWTESGTIWDCLASGYDADEGIIWRDGITQLSEWTTGNNVGPTVVRLKDMTATSERDKILPAILSAGLVGLLAAGLFWRRRVRLHR